MNKKVRKAVFPVGGLGTRFLPATKSSPKEMLPIANKPLIQHAFEEAAAAGIEEFIFITGRNKNAINNHFDQAFELEHALSTNEKCEALRLTRDWLPSPGNIVFIRQQQPLGLGHAIWCARNLIQDESFAVILADELFITDSKQSLLKEMVAVYDKLSANIIGVHEIDRSQSHKYGMIKGNIKDENIFNIEDMLEKPSSEETPSNLSIMGRYILDAKIFSYIENVKPCYNGEIQLTDAMKAMIGNQKFYGYKAQGKRLDCGTPIGFFEANLEFALDDINLKNDARKILNRILDRING